MNKRPLPGIIAHRGGRKWAPENTLSAFRKSVEAGVDGVEFDVHRCASGELVVIHDDTLQRTTDGVGLIKDASYDELKRLSSGSWFAPEFKPERIPLLSEVLSLFNDRMTINIEVKNAPVGYEGIEHDLLAALENYPFKDNLVVSSFDHLFLRKFRTLEKNIKTGVLGAALLVDIGEYAAKLKAQYYIQAIDCSLPEGLEQAKAAGLKVIVWTLNEPVQWQKALSMDVDAIVTDDPEGLKCYFEQLSSAARSS